MNYHLFLILSTEPNQNKLFRELDVYNEIKLETVEASLNKERKNMGDTQL